MATGRLWVGAGCPDNLQKYQTPSSDTLPSQMNIVGYAGHWDACMQVKDVSLNRKWAGVVPVSATHSQSLSLSHNLCKLSMM